MAKNRSVKIAVLGYFGMRDTGIQVKLIAGDTPATEQSMDGVGIINSRSILRRNAMCSERDQTS